MDISYFYLLFSLGVCTVIGATVLKYSDDRFLFSLMGVGVWLSLSFASYSIESTTAMVVDNAIVDHTIVYTSGEFAYVCILFMMYCVLVSLVYVLKAIEGQKNGRRQ